MGMPEHMAFSVNFDYRCPFARNAHEHVITALRGGAPYDVRFVGFSLGQVHVQEGATSVFDDPSERSALVAVAAGIVVRDRFPDVFLDTHLALFAARHDDGGNLRDEAVVRSALEKGGADADAVFAELDKGWPFETFRADHDTSTSEHAAFGVPTFVVGDQAAFVRVMTRPSGDTRAARATIDRVLDLVSAHPELNEVKHTTVPR